MYFHMIKSKLILLFTFVTTNLKGQLSLDSRCSLQRINYANVSDPCIPFDFS